MLLLMKLSQLFEDSKLKKNANSKMVFKLEQEVSRIKRELKRLNKTNKDMYHSYFNPSSSCLINGFSRGEFYNYSSSSAPHIVVIDQEGSVSSTNGFGNPILKSSVNADITRTNLISNGYLPNSDSSTLRTANLFNPVHFTKMYKTYRSKYKYKWFKE